MNRLNDIPVLLDVVEAGSFSAAAERLNLTRSAVAKSIARLESRLGVRLFHRTTRRQSLTEEGLLFHERCLRAVEEIRLGETLLESGRREIRGRLRISLPVVFGRRVIAPILTGLIDRHPLLELDLAFSDRVVDLLDEGFDLAVRNGNLPDTPDLMVRRVGGQRMTVCAAPAYLARRPAPETLDDLVGHDGVVYARRDGAKGWVFPTETDPDRVVRPPARLRLDDIEAIHDAACAGLGLAWLPCWLVRDGLSSGALCEVLTGVKSLNFDAYAVWPRAPMMTPRLRLVIDELAAKLPTVMD